MSKTFWFVSVSILTLFAVGSSLQSRVSPTPGAHQTGSSMPAAKRSDMSFASTDRIVPADSIPAAKASEHGWGPARLTDW